MPGTLDGKTIAFLATEGVEQVELTEPWKAVEEAGGTPELISLEDGEVQALQPPRQGRHVPGRPRGRRTRTPSRYDGLVLPGGVANPDFLRVDRDAVAFVRAFFEQAKPVAVICHGPWTLVEADVVRGPHADLVAVAADGPPQRGRDWVDEEVHVDEGLVTSRNPDDLPAFCAKLVEEFAEGEHEGSAERARTREARRRRSSTSTARSSTRTTTTRSPGTGRSARSGETLPLSRDPPAHRDGRRPAGRRPRRRRLRARARRRRARRPRGDRYAELIEEVEPLAGARDLLVALHGRAAAPSCSPPRPRRTRSTTTSTCSTRATWPTAGRRRPTWSETKPEPDLVVAAVEKAGGGPGGDGGRLDVGLRGGGRAGVPAVGRAHGRLLRAGAARRGRRRRVPRSARRCSTRWTRRRSAGFRSGSDGQHGSVPPRSGC